MPDLRISEVLDLAADTIQLRGWNGLNDDYSDPWGSAPNSKVCLEGALYAAVGIDRDELYVLSGLNPGTLSLYCPAYGAVHAYLQLDEATRLWQWNDKKGRTEQQVIEVLRAAAAVQRVKEESLNTMEVAA